MSGGKKGEKRLQEGQKQPPVDNRDLKDKVGELGPYTHLSGNLSRAFRRAKQIIASSPHISLYHHNDPDGLFAAIGVQKAVAHINPRAQVDVMSVPRMDYEGLASSDDSTVVTVDLPCDDIGRLIASLKGSPKKVIVMDHHRDHISDSENTSLVNLVSHAQKPVTATEVVWLFDISTRSRFNKPETPGRNLAIQLARMTDGMIRGNKLRRIAKESGFDDPADFCKLSRVVFDLANKEIERVKDKPHVWPKGHVPRLFSEGTFKSMPEMIYDGLVTGEEVRDTTIFDFPEVLDFDKAAQYMLDNRRGRSKIGLVLPYLSPQADGIMASTLYAVSDPEDVEMVAIFQKAKEAEGSGTAYTLKARASDTSHLEPLFRQGKLYDAHGQRYVSTPFTQPVTESDIQVLGKAQDMRLFTAESDPLFFKNFMHMDVARQLHL